MSSRDRGGLFFLACLLTACTSSPPPPPNEPPPVATPVAPASAPAATAPVTSQRQALYRETLDLVHAKIGDALRDPAVGGVNWAATGDEFRKRVESAQSDADFHALLNEMLARLGKSHFGVIPAEAYAPDEGDHATQPTPGAGRAGGGGTDETVAAAPAEARDGVVGAEIAIVEGRPTIASVVSAGPAQRAGLRPGFVISRIDATEVESLAKRIALRSKSESMRGLLLAGAVHHALSGPAGSRVVVGYTDGNNDAREASFERVAAPRHETVQFGELPEWEICCERRLLEGGIGYVRFNIFLMPLLPKIKSSIRSHKNAKGLILDLRGNPGGVGGMASAVAGAVARERGDLGISRMSAGEIHFPVFPAPDAVTIPLVVLVDSGSASTSEILAAGLQECGRAVVVGTPSAGAVLLALVEKLPTGARLEYAFGDFKTLKGRELEGVGVVPDLTVPLARSALLRGEDNVLEVARRLLAGP